MKWWVRPAIRFLAAMSLPFLVPLIITGAMWLLPGDPAEIICPKALCPATDSLRAKWHLDEGPLGYYQYWLSNAAEFDFGPSMRVLPGTSVNDLIIPALPTTTLLLLLALLPVLVGSVLSARGTIPRRLDGVWQFFGLIPAVILALILSAVVDLNIGHDVADGLRLMVRLLFGAVVLCLSDGTFAAAISGTRGVFDTEMRQRYIQVCLLRGETPLQNALPNVLPALVGQFRGRILHILSGTVIVEVVLQLDGLGSLLWRGTLKQDFAVVLAAAWAFSLLSGLLLLIQALVETMVEMHVRRTPSDLPVEGVSP